MVKRYVLAACGLIAAILLAAFISSQGGHHSAHHVASASSTTSSTQPSDAASQLPSSFTPTTLSLPKPSQASQAAEAKLQQQVTAFMTAYYQVYSTDTYSSRRQRMAALQPALSATLLNSLSLNTYTTTQADQAYKQKGVVLSGQIVGQKIQSIPGHDTYRNVLSTIRVTGHSSTKSYGTLQTIVNASIWRLEPTGVWQCTMFYESPTASGG